MNKRILIGKKKQLPKDLTIPEGYRLIKDWELLRELREGNKELIKLCKNEYVWGEINNIRVCRLYGFDDDSYFYAFGRNVVDSLLALRGVFMVKRNKVKGDK